MNRAGTGPNALTDLPWMPYEGGLTPRETLLSAHELAPFSSAMTGYEAGATIRMLASLLALVMRELGVRRVPIDEPLPIEAVDAALGSVEAGAFLRDPAQPFLQRPAVPDAGNSDTHLGAGEKPLHKLNPTSPSDKSSEFWNLATTRLPTLSESQACMALAIHHNYSMAGNNTYGGDKCAMGAPGIRYLGVGNAATEVVWAERTLLGTLLDSIPLSWVKGVGLPAWADRECRQSRDGAGEHPLWRATWTSNTAAIYWEDNLAAGVRVGGVPQEWYSPSMGATKESRKAWWDQRNTEDPFYLYAPDAGDNMKCQRLDIGLDATAMAVHWNATGNPRALRRQTGSRLRTPNGDVSLAFLRHRVEGAASSPVIRASEVFRQDAARWAPREGVAEDLSECSKTIEQVLNITASPFRRAKKGQKSFVLDPLAARRPDLVTAFWRRLAHVFDAMVEVTAAEHPVGDSLWEATRQAALQAFDETVEPHYGQLSAQIEHVRGYLDRNLRATIREMKQGDAGE